MSELQQSKGCWQSVYTQVLIMGFIAFGLPGAFNGILGLKSGVPASYNTAGDAILYFTFAFGSLVTPALTCKFGPRTMMFAGGCLYGLFSLSLLLANPKVQVTPPVFVTIAAGMLGFGAAMFWAGNGAMLLSYPTENLKASYFGTFWVIFNLGSFVGGIQTYLTNLNAEGVTAAPISIIIYVIVNVIGCGLVWTLQPLESVVRADGTKCPKMEPGNVGQELRGMLKMMTFKPVLALLPLFLYSNWFYSFQLTTFNESVFGAAGAGLSEALYWGAQMVGAKMLACLLDARSMSSGRRAWVSIVASTILITIGWSWGYQATISYGIDQGKKHNLQWNDSRGINAMLLMFFWGYCDALVQTWSYWVMTQLYSSPEDFARVVGIFKFAQSLGSCISFFLNFLNPPNMAQFWIVVILFIVSMPGGFYLCHYVCRFPKRDDALVV